VRKDPLLWAALAAALVVTASAEYQLARDAGFGVYVAAGVPCALDVYAIRALRVRRDVAAVVVAMILVNAVSHLVAAGLLPVSVAVVVGVSAIAPLIVWRVHRITEHTPAVGVSTPPAPAVEVNTSEPEESKRDIVPLAPVPQVICGAQRVYDLAVHPVAEPGEVDTRLDAEQARMLIEYAWASGLSVREAARVSTRSPSYANKVYTALDRENGAGPDRPALEAVTA
jgi:hypothetical protein